MTVISIVAVVAGIAILALIPLPKERLWRLSSMGAGAVLFAVGLVGLIFGLATTT